MIPPLKPFFHRTKKTGGNKNTINVSSYYMTKMQGYTASGTVPMKGIVSANFKEVMMFGDDPEGRDDVTIMSIDTGANGNLFGGNYFNLNDDHLKGKLK